MQTLRQDASTTRMQATASRVINSSPQLLDSFKQDNRRDAASPQRVNDDELPVNQSEWRKEKDKYDAEIKNLSEQLRHRTQVYLQREAEMNRKIDGLEKQLEKRIDSSYDKKMENIRSLHRTIINGIMTVQGNTAKVLQDQEKDLMRAFRARLDDVTKELEIQKIRRNDTSMDLQAQHRHLVAEWQRAKELAELFEAKNQQFVAENAKLKEKLRTRDDDKQATLKSLILAKRDSNRLQSDLEVANQKNKELEREIMGLKDQLASVEGFDSSNASDGKGRLGECASRVYQRELKYREAIARCKKLLEVERATNRQLREAHNRLLTSRTELEVLLKQSLDDVKGQIRRKRLEVEQGGKSPAGVAAASLPATIHDLSAADRERVLEMLLSQQRVITLLYEKSFPAQQEAAAPPSAAELNEEEGHLAGVGVFGGEDDIDGFDSIMRDLAEEGAADGIFTPMSQKRGTPSSAATPALKTGANGKSVATLPPLAAAKKPSLVNSPSGLFGDSIGALSENPDLQTRLMGGSTQGSRTPSAASKTQPRPESRGV